MSSTYRGTVRTTEYITAVQVQIVKNINLTSCRTYFSPFPDSGKAAAEAIRERLVSDVNSILFGVSFCAYPLHMFTSPPSYLRVSTWSRRSVIHIIMFSIRP